MWSTTPIWLFFASFIISIPICKTNAQSLTDLLKRHTELSEVRHVSIFGVGERKSVLNASLPWRQGTLFAPTNTAIREHRQNGGKIDNYTILYHLANVAKRTTDLEDTLTSELPGNSPIYISRKSETEIYLNDARIDGKKRNFQVKNTVGLDQVLHVIDRVLDPAVPDSSDSNLLNPDARRFLENSSSYNITGVHRISEFARKCAQLRKLEMFRTIGRHTFFIPVDEAFNSIQISTVDAKVIDGHVIPNHVIFLRPAELKKQYETAAFSSSLPVFVEFDRPNKNGDGRWIVRSDTRSADGDQFHLKGVVQTEVVKGNIPVKNGVVHLISKPLVVIDSSVYQTLANEKLDGPTYEFFKLIKDYGTDEVKNLLQNPDRALGLTVFVPSNQVLRSSTLNVIKSNVTQLDQIIRLHIVQNTVRSDNITEASERAPFQVQTAAPNKKLFFNYQMVGERRHLYVEGGGVNASITQPDIGATNGVIHMIDRVLGFADQNIFDKLKTDPMLQKTFELTSQDNFNRQFQTSNLTFTLFAPSNLAWEKIYRSSPSEYRKLQMGGFGYHVAKIMERHMIVTRAFTIEQLRELSSSASEHAYPIQAVHGILRVENRADLETRFRNTPYHTRGTYAKEYAPEHIGPYDYSVTWMNERAQVVRPNIICTNGIIHIIDNVLMQPDDVTVAYISTPSSAPLSHHHIPHSAIIIISSLITFFAYPL